MSGQSKPSPGELAGGLCIILGGLLLVGGFVAYFYEETILPGLWITHPYRDLAIPLVVLGVVLIVPGAFLYSYAPKATPAQFFCPYCGKENRPDAVYCEGCGKKL